MLLLFLCFTLRYAREKNKIRHFEMQLKFTRRIFIFLARKLNFPQLRGILIRDAMRRIVPTRSPYLSRTDPFVEISSSSPLPPLSPPSNFRVNSQMQLQHLYFATPSTYTRDYIKLGNVC